MPVTTLQGTEEGRPSRRQTAMKYARALHARGVDPNEVEEVRASLGEVFLVDPDPEVLLWHHAMRAWEEMTRGLVSAGFAKELRSRFRVIEEEIGEEGERVRNLAQEEAHRIAMEEEG